MLFVNSYLFPSFPLAYISVIDPPAKSIVSPILYSFFVGATNFMSFMQSSPTVTLKYPSYFLLSSPVYVTFNICCPGVVLLYPVTIFSVNGTVFVVPSSIWIFTVPPARFKFSPYLQFVFVGAITSIWFIVFITATWNVFVYVFPSLTYFTVRFFVPGVVLSNPLIMLFVNAIMLPFAPLAIFSVMLPPTKLNVSPILYSFLVGGVSVMSFT